MKNVARPELHWCTAFDKENIPEWDEQWEAISYRKSPPMPNADKINPPLPTIEAALPPTTTHKINPVCAWGWVQKVCATGQATRPPKFEFLVKFSIRKRALFLSPEEKLHNNCKHVLNLLETLGMPFGEFLVAVCFGTLSLCNMESDIKACKSCTRNWTGSKPFWRIHTELLHLLILVNPAQPLVQRLFDSSLVLLSRMYSPQSLTHSLRTI